MKRTLAGVGMIALLLTGCSAQGEDGGEVETTAVVAPSKQEQDAEYLALLDRRGAIEIGDDQLAIHRADEVCTSFETRQAYSAREEADRWESGGAISHRPSIEVMIRSAVEVYCPQFE